MKHFTYYQSNGLKVWRYRLLDGREVVGDFELDARLVLLRNGSVEQRIFVEETVLRAALVAVAADCPERGAEMILASIGIEIP